MMKRLMKTDGYARTFNYKMGGGKEKWKLNQKIDTKLQKLNYIRKVER